MELAGKQQNKVYKRRAPRVIEPVWQQYLKAHDNDADAEQTTISRLLATEAARLVK